LYVNPPHILNLKSWKFSLKILTPLSDIIALITIRRESGAFMTFNSILFEKPESNINEETVEVPLFFVDLNLDQIIETITDKKKEYNLKPFFYTPLKDMNTIKYRQAIMRDLENKDLYGYINSFARKMSIMRKHLVYADKLFYKYQKEEWFLGAVEIYCEAINSLVQDLSLANLKSSGLIAFREYIINYSKAEAFMDLQEETKKLRADLATVKYSILIKGNSIKVQDYNGEVDYSIQVQKTFEKFRQGAVKDYQIETSDHPVMNDIEMKIMDIVGKLYPEIFLNLDNYPKSNSDFVDETLGVFDREIQFYMGYLEYLKRFREGGLKFCYPEISSLSKEICNYEGFDIALANKLIKGKTPVICNDFYLKGKERIFVISGPNQGGKTTFARSFGQMHYLASLGCLVPGREAKLFLFDSLFTHFETEENMENLSGKLQDDLIRIHDIINQATPSSIIIMNEIFTSTTLKDAIYLGKSILDKIIELDLLCVCVTFLDELSSIGGQTVSLVSTIVPENKAVRTYKIVRKPADGLSYAVSIAEKYGLTYACLKERMKL